MSSVTRCGQELSERFAADVRVFIHAAEQRAVERDELFVMMMRRLVWINVKRYLHEASGS